MEALQNRIDSFKPKRIKHGSKNINAKWPHGDTFAANPLSLAEAGFYYDPSYEDRDAVKCYMCMKSLSDWEEEDDPFEIHWSKCAKTCAWAVVRCGLRDDIGPDGSFEFTEKSRLPTSKSMEKARLATFTSGSWWPYNNDHGASPLKMAQAGFVYTPQFPNDDLATCLYCKVSLSGWDEDDDPLEEHRKRERKSGLSCPFFALSEPPKPPSRKPSSKTSVSKGHKPKASSRSESAAALFDDELEEEEERPAVMKGAKTPKKPGGTSTAKTPRTVTRSKSKPAIVEEEDDDEDNVEPPPKPPPKSSRSRAKSKAVYEDVEEEIVDEAKPRSTKQRKSSRARSKSRAPSDDEKSGSSKRQKQTSTTLESNNDGSESEYHSVAESSRATSRGTSKSRTKAPSPLGDDGDDFPASQPRPSTRPTTGHSRKPSRSKAKPSVVPDPSDVPQSSSTRTKAIAMPEPEPAPNPLSSKPALARKPSRSKSKAKLFPEPDPVEETQVSPPPPPPKKLTRTSSKALPKSEPTDDDIIIPPKASKGKSKARAVSQQKLPSPRSPSPEPEEFHDALGEGDDHVSMDIADGHPSPVMEPVFNEPRDEDVQMSAPLKRHNLSLVREDDESLFSEPEDPFSPVKPLKIGPPRGVSRQPSTTVPRPQPQPTSNVLRVSKDIVDVLTDEEEDRPSVPPPVMQKKPTVASTKPVVQVEVVLPPPPQPRPVVKKSDQRAPPMPSLAKDDVDMDQKPSVEPPTQPSEVIAPPQTPRKTKVEAIPAPVTPPAPSASEQPEPPALPAFHPPLSKLPFQQIDQLSEAELEMTVEEWIRYQMKIEFIALVNNL
ncbi:hypothetical protein ONZ45_g279 [Pleurotus djamor]|nr:hypothetical protein ONZ45_g279 [Pleurotus djamor]